MPVPMAIKVPNVPPPWSITFPTLFINSLPLTPYLSAENPPNKAPEAMPTQNPIIKPIFILSQHEGDCWYAPPGTTGILIFQASAEKSRIVSPSRCGSLYITIFESPTRFLQHIAPAKYRKVSAMLDFSWCVCRRRLASLLPFPATSLLSAGYSSFQRPRNLIESRITFNFDAVKHQDSLLAA